MSSPQADNAGEEEGVEWELCEEDRELLSELR